MLDMSNPLEQATHDEIVKLVEAMLGLQKERQGLSPLEEPDQVRNLDRDLQK
jgi:hypothetical protein